MAVEGPEKNENEANLRTSTYAYKVRYKIDDFMKEVDVCQQAFMSIHGIKKKKVAYLQNSLKLTGMPPKDRRGENKTYPRKFHPHVQTAVYDHIKSFKGRQSHYSMKDSKKIYLPEDLNIKKMFKLFCELHPAMKISYEYYRTIINTKFNISFGYPRTDTCSTCDEYLIKAKSLESDILKAQNVEEKESLQQQLKMFTIMNELHKRKAEVFYARKRSAKKRSRTSESELQFVLILEKIYVSQTSQLTTFTIKVN